MKSNLIQTVILATLVLLTAPSAAETFPSLQLERFDGTRVQLGERSESPTIVVLGKQMPKNRTSNKNWLEALRKKLGPDSGTLLFMIGDLSGRPSFISKSMIKKKFQENSEDKRKEEMSRHMLLDWDGAARKLLAKDAQHYVYLLDQNGNIVETVVGICKPKKVDALLRALTKLNQG